MLYPAIKGDLFFEPYLLSFDSKGQAIFLHDTVIVNQDNEVYMQIDDDFKALISSQKKAVIYAVRLDHENNKIVIEKRDHSFKSVGVCEINVGLLLVDIYDVFFDSDELNLYLF